MITESDAFRKEKESKVKLGIDKVEMSKIGSVAKRLVTLAELLEKSFKKERIKCYHAKKSEALLGFEEGEFINCSHKDHRDAGSMISTCSLENCPFTKRK